MKKEPYKDFESALAALEQKVQALEGGNLPLEEALKVFEEGMAVANVCNRKLKDAEARVEILLKGSDGEMRAEPFPPLEEPAAREGSLNDDVPF